MLRATFRSISSIHRQFRTRHRAPCTLYHTNALHSVRPSCAPLSRVRSVGNLASATPISSVSSMAQTGAITYLKQQQAVAIDEELMGPLGFSVDQLMELAGLSCACAIQEQYPLEAFPRVLVLAGPGNNGGDGLVAARHLHHFGYQVKVCYPKPTDKPLYRGLITQCTALNIPLLEWSDIKSSLGDVCDVVVDALFGFSFKGQPRSPFDEVLQALHPDQHPPPIVSVDIPSGWDVELGDPEYRGIRPDMLISLTAPKEGSRSFQGRYHYLGGRFVPPALRDKYNLQLPSYPGAAMCVRLQPDATAAAKVSDMRISYERGHLCDEDFTGADPMKVWDTWFKGAVESKVCEEPNAISLASSDSQGRPSVRVVLLKGYDDRGFIFYTNYSSRKGQELDAAKFAAFSVYWEKTQQQVRVEGIVERVSESESTAYFHSRPKGSQIGAWVSNQSQPLPNGRGQLEERDAELQARYSDPSTPVPKPPHWGGYLIRPTRMEFWQGRPSRLHDRICFKRDKPQDQTWAMERLQP